VNDPAADLAIICAVLSSNFDFAIPGNYCFAGEVGLSGEIRPVAQTDRRIIEAARLGFKKIFVSSYSSLGSVAKGAKGSEGSSLPEGIPAREDKSHLEGIQVVKVADVPALVKTLFKNA